MFCVDRRQAGQGRATGREGQAGQAGRQAGRRQQDGRATDRQGDRQGRRGQATGRAAGRQAGMAGRPTGQGDRQGDRQGWHKKAPKFLGSRCLVFGYSDVYTIITFLSMKKSSQKVLASFIPNAV